MFIESHRSQSRAFVKKLRCRKFVPESFYLVLLILLILDIEKYPESRYGGSGDKLKGYSVIPLFPHLV